MFLSLNDKYGNSIIIYVVYDSIVSCNMSRICDVISSDQCFWMSQTCTWMLHDVHEYCRSFLEQTRIGFFPFPQSFVSLLGIFYLVHHRLSKYFCISSGVLQTMVSPRADSSRAFLMRAYSAGVMCRSSLSFASLTEAMPRISLSALFISEAIEPGSNVTIICEGCGIEVAIAIIGSFFNNSFAKVHTFSDSTNKMMKKRRDSRVRVSSPLLYMLYKREWLWFSGDDGDGRGERASCCWTPAACPDRSCNPHHVGLTR